MNFGASEAERIRTWNDGLSRPVSIRFWRTRDERSSELGAFCDELTRLAPKVRIEPQDTEEGGPPALLIGKGWRYHAVPLGGELAPFLELLSMLDRGEPDISESVRKRLEGIDWPASLKIYVTPQCPFCPQVLQQIQLFPMVNPILHLTVIDGLLFPEMAGRDGARSAPTIMLDDEFRWTGFAPPEEILDALAHRDPTRLSPKTLEDLLKEGNADRLSRMMLDKDLIFPAFLDLLVHPEWSVRLGAMVVLEEIADQRPELAGRTTAPLLEQLESPGGKPVKGDLIYLLGLAGSGECVPTLQAALAVEESEELREILSEALEKIRGRIEGAD